MTNEQQDTKNILIISPHADDHISCAGTVYKLQKQGYCVYELILTDSSEGRDFRDPDGDYNVASMRQDEFSEASKLLGTKEVFSLGLEDLGLAYNKTDMMRIVDVIRKVKPAVGIIMHSFDWHPDHTSAYELSRTAFKFAATGVQPERGEAHRTPMVLMAEGMLPIEPQVLVDITEEYEQKMALWKVYESQAKPEGTDFINGLMSVRGYHVRKGGQRKAEAFSIDSTSPILLFE